MNKNKKIFTALIVSLLGFCMMVTAFSMLTANISLVVFFSIGLGLLVGPILGILLSLILKDQNMTY